MPGFDLFSEFFNKWKKPTICQPAVVALRADTAVSTGQDLTDYRENRCSQCDAKVLLRPAIQKEVDRATHEIWCNVCVEKYSAATGGRVKFQYAGEDIKGRR